MSTKRKLYLSILSLVFVILAMGVATFSILSATQQYISANLSIVYNADNIKAKIKGKYSVNGATPVSLINSVGGDVVSFESKEDYSAKTLSNGGVDIQLSPTNTSVLFVYTFINANPSGGTAMKVTFTDGSAKSNLTVKYLASTTSEPTLAQTKASSDTTGSFTLTIPAGTSGYVAIYMEITSIYSDAYYTSSTTAGIVSDLKAST